MWESWFDYVNQCEDVFITMWVHMIIGDGDEVWMIYIRFGDEVAMWRLVISYVDDLNFYIYLIYWMRMHVIIVLLAN